MGLEMVTNQMAPGNDRKNNIYCTRQAVLNILLTVPDTVNGNVLMALLPRMKY